MAQSTMKKILNNALLYHYAVPAFNVYNMETINAVTAAAEELNSPFILAMSPGTVEHIGMKLVTVLARNISWRSKVPMSLHLDHGHDSNFIRACIDAGFDSVMIDASTDNFEKNIALTRDVVNYARGGVFVEAELGCIGGFNTGTNTLISNDWLTDPDCAASFAAKTGIDALAIAIGTRHGPYRTTPELDFERLRTIRERVSIPLVLHGASGLTPEQIQQVVAGGINKINFATDLKIAFTNSLRDWLTSHQFDYDMRWYLKSGQDAVKAVAMEKIRDCGSVGKGRVR